MSNVRRHNHFLRSAYVLIMAVALVLPSLPVRAATVTGFSDLVGRLQVGVAANHEIKFVTPTGVQSTGDIITLGFQADYGLSAISFADIDLAVDDDGAPGDCSGSFDDVKILAAAANATDWGASVSGQTLTLTPRTGAAIGEVPAGSCIRVLIGENATGGAANEQVINPSTPTAHAITLGGGFGDTGVAYTLNVDVDRVTVSATVGGGGGGNPGPSCPPTCPAPVIYNVRVQYVTDTAADVRWDTDIASTSFVDYGTTAAYGRTASVGGMTFNHGLQLTGLTPGTTYHFRVRSAGIGPESVSGDGTFTTVAVPDSLPPAINGIQALDVTGTSARIVWDTDEDADSRVDFGIAPGPPYASNVTSAILTNAHSLALTGLTPNTLYRYRVTSKDAAGNSSTSTEFVFSTLDTLPPVISGIAVDAITQDSARISWATGEFSDSTVRYGVTDAYGAIVQDGMFVANHRVDLTGLAAGTAYHFSVSSYDDSGNGATSTDQTFMTLADSTPPPNVSGFRVTAGDRQAQLSWVNPSDPEFAGVRIKRSTSGFPTEPASGVTVYDSNGASVIDVGLTNGTTYYYSAFAYDASGNFASGALASGVPFDTSVPGPVTGFSVMPDDARNALAWTHPDDADFDRVRVQRSASGFPSGPSVGTNVYLGTGTSFQDVGLTNGTTYYYAAFAIDTSGNVSVPVQGSGTPNAMTPPASACGDNACVAPENSTSCPADCAAGGPICGNLSCEPTETNASCPADCPAGPPPQPGPACGNAACELPEDHLSCPADCQAPPESPIITPPQTSEASIDRGAIGFYALGRRLQLHPDREGFYRILQGRSLAIMVPDEAMPKTAVSVVLNFGTGSYLFQKPADGEGDWTVDIVAPMGAGLAEGAIIVTYDDGTTDVMPFEVRVESPGQVYAVRDGKEDSVSGAVVTIYRRINPWIVWDAPAYLQVNPVTTGEEGTFAFMAPVGEYYISVSKDGYRTHDTAPFDLTTEVVNPKIELIALPPSIMDVIVPGAPIVENIANVAKALGAQGEYVTKVIRNEIVEDPRVKSAATVYAVPAAAAVTTAVVATAVQATGFVSYLYFLVTQPLLLIARRRRKGFGTIYDALTKLPIDLATVRLFRADGRLVRTIVTDRQGRYAFLVDPGEYRIEATKPGFIFPTRYLKARKEDNQYLDLYHGETVQVGESGAVIAANIPLDPIEHVKAARRLWWESAARRLQGVMAFSGVALTIFAALAYGLGYLWAFAAFQAALYALFRRLARPKRPKNWGIIYDEKTKKPVPFAVARIVETQYSKVLESRVADARGRYNFLVGNNKYVVTVEKPGYEPKRSAEIDLTARRMGEGVVDFDIGLKEKPPSGPPAA